MFAGCMYTLYTIQGNIVFVGYMYTGKHVQGNVYRETCTGKHLQGNMYRETSTGKHVQGNMSPDRNQQISVRDDLLAYKYVHIHFVQILSNTFHRNICGSICSRLQLSVNRFISTCG